MSVRRIHTIHPPRDNRLPLVLDEMRKMGSPTIQLVDCGDHHFALEGCNRIEAACQLSVLPKWQIFKYDELLPLPLDAGPEVKRKETGEDFVLRHRSDTNGIYVIENGKLRRERAARWL